MGARKRYFLEDALALEEERTKAGREGAAIDENYHDFSYQRAAYLATGLYAE